MKKSSFLAKYLLIGLSVFGLLSTSACSYYGFYRADAIKVLDHSDLIIRMRGANGPVDHELLTGIARAKSACRNYTKRHYCAGSVETLMPLLLRAGALPQNTTDVETNANSTSLIVQQSR